MTTAPLSCAFSVVQRQVKPAIALVLFLIGAALGITIVLNALFRDRKAKPHEERGPR